MTVFLPFPILFLQNEVNLYQTLIPTMSLTLRCPPVNTIAFGGVATGNMKANEHEIVAGSMRYHG